MPSATSLPSHASTGAERSRVVQASTSRGRGSLLPTTMFPKSMEWGTAAWKVRATRRVGAWVQRTPPGFKREAHRRKNSTEYMLPLPALVRKSASIWMRS